MSDSDSEDDLLSGAPIFSRKRPNRKQTATATKRQNLLDSMLTQQDERINRQTRIQETLIKEKEGFVPDEKERIDSLDSVKGKGSASAAAAAAIAAGGNAQSSNSDAFGSAEKKDGKRTSEDLTPPLDTCTKHVTYDFDDPSYWSKIDALKKNGNEALHERRRKIENEINGFDMNNEFGSPQDGADGIQTEEDRERWMAEISGRHSNLGTRQTLGWSHENNDGDAAMNDWRETSSLAPFSSLEDAMEELVPIFRMYDCAPKRGLGTEGRQQWNGIRNKIIQPMIRADGLDILPQMLARHWKPDLEIPEDLLFWLVRVATTGMMVVGTELCLGAFTMVKTVFEAKMTVLRFDGGGPETISEVLHMTDFIPMLQTYYGLWKIKSGSSLASNTVAEIENVKFDEPSGLEHAFKIWTVAIANDMTTFQPEIDAKQTLLSQAVAMVLCCGLDPIFYSGHNLLECQGKLLETLLEHVYHQSKENRNTEVFTDFNKWIESTAELTLDICDEQFSKLPKTDEEDKDDEEGWLPMEVVIRSWQTIQKHESVCIFYSSLCNLALQKCMEDVCNWNAEVQRSTLTLVQMMNKDDNTEEKLKEHINLRYRTIAMAETALGMLTKSTYNNDGPRILATIRIAGICEQVGIELFMSNIQKALIVSRNRGFCESDSEAAMLYEHFSHMCNICQHLKKSIRVVLNPHMRRAKELVLLLYSFYDKCKLKVSSWDKGRKTEKRRQSSLSSLWELKEDDDEED